MDHEQTLRPHAAVAPPPPVPPHSVGVVAPHYEVTHAAIAAPGSRDSHAGATHESQTSSTDQPLLKGASEGQHTSPHFQGNPFDPVPPPPPARSRDGHGRTGSRHRNWGATAGLPPPHRNTSGVDWIVPVEEKGTQRRTVGERLDPTIDNALAEREKYARKAMWTGYALNIAIGMQVFLGAMTTGLAAAVKDARQAQLSTAILGGLSTMVASYLARARGSGEPEVSIVRVKDLDHFLRDCRAFRIDHQHEYASPGDHLDHQLHELRRRLEELLGNVTNAKNSTAPLGQNPPTQSQQAVP